MPIFTKLTQFRNLNRVYKKFMKKQLQQFSFVYSNYIRYAVVFQTFVRNSDYI